MPVNPVSALLDSLRSSGETLFCEENQLAPEVWQRALAAAAPLPAIRQLKLAVESWDARLLVALARVFPAVDTLDFSQTMSLGGDRASLDELLAAFWNHPLTSLSVTGLRRWTKPLPPSLPAFQGTLEFLSLPAAKAAGIGAFLAEKSPFPRLEALAVGVVDSVVAVVAACPALRSLSVFIDPKYTPRLVLESSTLEDLSVSIVKRPADTSLTLAGSLPSLRQLDFHHAGAAQVDPGSLATLLATARASLESLSLSGSPGWELAGAAGRALAALPGPRLPVVEVRLGAENRAPGALARQRWGQLESLLLAGFEVDPVSMLEICDRPEFFRALVPHLPAALLSLELNQDAAHDFLLEEPELLAPLTHLEALHLRDAEGLTSERLARLIAALPGLERLRLTSNHNPACRRLGVRSAKLRELTVSHFHCLETFELDLPALEQLELDNCDRGTLDGLDQRPEVGEGIVYGNFPLLVLSDLLDGAASVQAPGLRELLLWHNPYSLGPLVVFEELRVDIRCLAGHPALEKLVCHNTPHLRRLQLRRLPALRSVHAGVLLDEGPGTTWLEEVSLDGLPEGCEVDLCSLSPGRRGLAL
jgi:hypothetical protein